jgi:hypothetical protein
MAARPAPRYYDHLAGRLREFAAARIVTSLARRPQTAYVVIRGRVPNLLRPIAEGPRAASESEDISDQTLSPAFHSPALFKRQITVPHIVPIRTAKPVGQPGNAFDLVDKSVSSEVARTIPDSVAALD